MTLQRQPYGKKIALAFAALVGLSLLVSYCYQRGQAQQAANDLLNLQHLAQRLARLQAFQPMPASLPLAPEKIIEQSAQRHRLARVAIAPSDGGFEVTLSPMPFDLLIAWLAELQREQGIRVQAIEVTALPASGMVRIDRLLLQRLLSY
ncbi:type II secretion system protein GspM [Serratia sp. L9]|uniref:type II secretion system protein GspM n=1 Tax=Serratia sp. L9 TaxID=3423946 RepID=UPI003D67B0C4